MSKCLWTGGSGSEELKKCPPPSPAVLWFVNVRERKPRQKKKCSSLSYISSDGFGIFSIITVFVFLFFFYIQSLSMILHRIILSNTQGYESKEKESFFISDTAYTWFNFLNTSSIKYLFFLSLSWMSISLKELPPQ